jgi:alpha-tubulin suppressor-like RCC1 family protein
VQVGSDTNWATVSAGQGAFAIKTNGTLWAWGSNYFGNLGFGNTINKTSVEQLGSDTNWYRISSGGAFAIAIKTNGTLWAWGINSGGVLGLGDATRRYSPVQVGALTNWAKIDMGSSGVSASIKTDGSLWTWGSNSFGGLGLGDTTNRSSPVQVGTRTAWANVFVASNTFAIG